MYRLILTFIVLGAFFNLQAQQHNHEHGTFSRCSFVKENQKSVDQPSNFERWIDKNISLSRTGGDEVLTIPVVFHIIHRGEDEGVGINLSETLIQAQLEQLNNDFRKKAGTSGDNTFENGADSKIEFKLALYAPDNSLLPQPGINRVNAITEGLNEYDHTAYYVNSYIKPATYWNPNEYLNIWVVDLPFGYLGYAQFPNDSNLEGMPGSGTAAAALTDGVVVKSCSVGSTTVPNPTAVGVYNRFNQGRTLTHELGHWLGLRHIWGDGGCSKDDYCTDTPLANSYHFGCPSNSSSCGSENMVQNYMDYTDDACMNVFTQQQKQRMRTVLSNATRRQALLSSTKANESSPLPVELFDFELKNNKEEVHLTWSTVSEQNNSHFTLLRSDDGVNFSPLTEISGAGNSTVLVRYQYIDKKPIFGNNYYRLIQVDFDGTKTVLGTRMAKIFKDLDMNISPNPVTENAILVIESKNDSEMKLEIFDARGQLILQRYEDIEQGKYQIDLDVSAFSNGIYIAKLTNVRNSKTFVQRFMKK